MSSIRAATTDDAAHIAHVHVASWRTTYTGIVPGEYLVSLDETERELGWKDWLTRDILAYVAELDGKIVGFISGGPIREPIADHDAELYAIYLLKSAQAQGIGQQLLQQLAVALLQKSFRSMMAWVLEQNPAKHFYARTGASPLTSKNIEIGGAILVEVAYGWPDLRSLI